MRLSSFFAGTLGFLVVTSRTFMYARLVEPIYHVPVYRIPVSHIVYQSSGIKYHIYVSGIRYPDNV